MNQGIELSLHTFEREKKKNLVQMISLQYSKGVV